MMNMCSNMVNINNNTIYHYQQHDEHQQKFIIPQMFVNEQDENYQQHDETLQLTT
jgi:hypothetical protein